MERYLSLDTVDELIQIMYKSDEIKLYGAGFYLNVFLNEIEALDKVLISKISCIMVSQLKGNSSRIKNINIISWKDCIINSGDIILLTLGERYTEEIWALLKGTGAVIYQINYNMFQKKPYNDVKSSIQPFINEFPIKVSNLNLPDDDAKDIILWVFWWQGIEEAPELVKACIKSQRRNIPSMARQIVITKDNYKEYISIPDCVMDKVENGNISLVTLSDIFRAALLYKYGGFWMDATLLILKPLSENILMYSIYTRNLPETQYCTDAMWADWFFFAKPGHILFQFLMESFFYYYSIYDKIKYYFTIDYFIAIACNMFNSIEEDLKRIPYNNERALELEKHITEPFDRTRYGEYVGDSSIQKLSYKIDWGNKRKAETIYEHIIKENE